MSQQDMVRNRRLKWPLALGCAVSAALAVAAVYQIVWLHHPAAAFEVPFRGYSIDCMRFSPDGRNLVVATNETGFGGAKEIDWIRIYRVADGSVVHEIENAGRMCAWNANGSVLAVASPNCEEYDLWNSRSWVPTNHLSVGVLEADKQLKALISTRVCQLCFDRQGSLYAALSVTTDMGGNRPPFDRARVWWHASDTAGEVKAEQIGSYPFAFDLSAASLGPFIRVAISCMDPENSVEILSVRKGRDGHREVKRDYDLSEFGTTDSLSICPAIRLTADGKKLAVRTLERFRLFQLFDDRAELLYSREDKIDVAKTGLAMGSVLDVSVDGRFAAEISTNRVKVTWLADGRSALEVPLEKYCRFALSPDATLLAVEERARKKICFYRVP